MANVSLDGYTFLQTPEDAQRRQRIPVPGLQVPEGQTQTPIPAAPQPSGPKTARDFGLDSDAPAAWTKFDNSGFTYDWRPQPYQSPLSAPEIEQQRQEYSYRASNPSQELPDDSAGLMQMIAQSQGGAPRPQAAPTSAPAPAPQPQRQTFDHTAPSLQFDDPYTKRLEELVNQQLKALETPQVNPAMDQFLNFLNNQFTTLSTAPGYSPEDLAVIRTQMLEPIERDRAANRARVEQRTASRGMLPSSGLHEQDLQEFVDRPAMEARTAAQRDLAIDAINRRRGDLNQAANFGRIGAIEVPGLMRAEDQQRRSEALNLASLLYDLPGRALQENLSVINGTPGPESLFNQAIQLQNQQNQQRALNQQKWAQIGQMLAGMFQ